MSANQAQTNAQGTKSQSLTPPNVWSRRRVIQTTFHMPLRSLPRPLAVLVKDPNKLDLMRSLSQSDEGAINIKARDGSCFSYAPILAAILFLLQILRAQEIMHHFTTLILIPLQMCQKDVVLANIRFMRMVWCWMSIGEWPRSWLKNIYSLWETSTLYHPLRSFSSDTDASGWNRAPENTRRDN